MLAAEGPVLLSDIFGMYMTCMMYVMNSISVSHLITMTTTLKIKRSWNYDHLALDTNFDSVLCESKQKCFRNVTTPEFHITTSKSCRFGQMWPWSYEHRTLPVNQSKESNGHLEKTATTRVHGVLVAALVQRSVKHILVYMSLTQPLSAVSSCVCPIIGFHCRMSHFEDPHLSCLSS